MCTTPRSPLTVAIAQCVSQPLDVAGNLTRMHGLARDAAAQGAHLLVLPEMFVTGYNIGAESVRQLARHHTGAYFEAASRIAKACHIALVFGYPEQADVGQIYNAAQWVDAHGAVQLNYRKTHLYGDLDRTQFSAAAVADAAQALVCLHGWQLSVLICYDVEFPENTRRLALAGADAVLVPTANMDRFDFVPLTLVPTRAFENQMVLAYANYCGTEGDIRYGGLSSVVDALGQPLALAGRDASLLLATLQPEALLQARQLQTHLRDLQRRPAA